MKIPATPFLLVVPAVATLSFFLVGTSSEAPGDLDPGSAARGPQTEPLREEDGLSPSPGREPPPGPGLLYDFRAGDSSLHEFHFKEAVRVRSSEETGPVLEVAEGLSLQFEGVLRITTYAPLGGAFLVGFAFESLRLSFELPGGSARAQDRSASLEVEILGLASPLGELWDIRVPNTLGGREASYLLACLDLSRIVLPGRPSQAWTTVEGDSLGSYGAEYKAIEAPEDSTTRIVKSRRYLDPKASSRGSTRAILGSDRSWPVLVSARELFRVEESRHGTALEASLEFRLERTALVRGDGTHPDAQERLAEHLGRPECPGPVPPRASRDASWKEFGLEDVLAASSEEDSVALVASLADLFQRDPTSADQAVTSIADGTIGGRTGFALVDALGRAGTPRTQAALASLIGEGSAPMAFRQAAVLAAVTSSGCLEGLVQRLEAQLDSRSRQGADPLSHSILEGMGILASRQDARGHREDATQARRLLENALGDSQETGWRAAALLGLGNAGSRESLETIARFASDPDPELRAKAALALRKMPFDRAYGLLRGLAEADLEEGVRETAARALVELDG